MIYPKGLNDGRGGFKNSRGRGFTHLKCESELPEQFGSVCFYLSVGGARITEASRGPVTHNFCTRATCSLQKDGEDWDFASVVNQEQQSFVVSVEIALAHLLT